MELSEEAEALLIAANTGPRRSVLMAQHLKERGEKFQRETVLAVIGDVCSWLNQLLPGIDINEHNFLEKLQNGVRLCDLCQILDPEAKLRPWSKAAPESFHARDNIAQFTTWLGVIGVHDTFETDDLALARNDKVVAYALLDMARRCAARGYKGPLPLLVSFEKEINEKPKEQPKQSSVERILEDIKSNRLKEGLYDVGHKRVHIRKVNKHIMVRTGGGWKVFEEFILTNFGFDVDVLVQPAAQSLPSTPRGKKSAVGLPGGGGGGFGAPPSPRNPQSQGDSNLFEGSSLHSNGAVRLSSNAGLGTGPVSNLEPLSPRRGMTSWKTLPAALRGKGAAEVAKALEKHEAAEAAAAASVLEDANEGDGADEGGEEKKRKSRKMSNPFAKLTSSSSRKGSSVRPEVSSSSSSSARGRKSASPVPRLGSPSLSPSSASSGAVVAPMRLSEGSGGGEEDESPNSARHARAPRVASLAQRSMPSLVGEEGQAGGQRGQRPSASPQVPVRTTVERSNTLRARVGRHNARSPSPGRQGSLRVTGGGTESAASSGESAASRLRSRGMFRRPSKEVPREDGDERGRGKRRDRARASRESANDEPDESSSPAAAGAVVQGKCSRYTALCAEWESELVVQLEQDAMELQAAVRKGGEACHHGDQFAQHVTAVAAALRGVAEALGRLKCDVATLEGATRALADQQQGSSREEQSRKTSGGRRGLESMLSSPDLSEPAPAPAPLSVPSRPRGKSKSAPELDIPASDEEDDEEAVEGHEGEGHEGEEGAEQQDENGDAEQQQEVEKLRQLRKAMSRGRAKEPMYGLGSAGASVEANVEVDDDDDDEDDDDGS